MKKDAIFLMFLAVCSMLANNVFSGINVSYSQNLNKTLDLIKSTDRDSGKHEIKGSLRCNKRNLTSEDVDNIDIHIQTKGANYEHMFDKTTTTPSYEIVFAKDEIILAFSRNSKLKNSLNKENWASIIKRNDTKVGLVSDFSKPCNITPLISLKLAEKAYRYSNFYNTIYSNALLYKNKNFLIDALKNNESDVALMHKSSAIINGLDYMELPGIVNLSENKYEKLYRETYISLTLSGNKETTYSGGCIYLSIAVSPESIHKPEVLSFIKNLLSDTTRLKLNNQGFNTDFYPEFHGNLKDLDFSLRGIVKYAGF